MDNGFDAKFEITMLGAKGVGKTSMIAAMWHEFDRLCEDSSLELLPNPQTEEELQARLKELQSVGSSAERVVQVTEGIQASVEPVAYQLTLKHLVCRSQFNILFHDIPGGWMDQRKQKFHRCVTKLKGARIILVAISVPSLMDSTDRNEVKNHPDDMAAAFKEAMGHWQNKPDETRLVLYVLMKGERWLRDGEGQKVLDRFERQFANVIRLVAARKSTTAAVICPIQTLGAVRFIGFDQHGNEQYERIPGEKYHPVDCDQPLRYSLAFLMGILNRYAESRVMDAKKALDQRGFFERMKDSALGLFDHKSEKQKAFDAWCEQSVQLWSSVSKFASGCKHPEDPLFKVLHNEDLIGAKRSL
jgi:hypothetical protein